MNYKLVVAVRSDLQLSPGKLAVQVAHASIMAALEAKASARVNDGHLGGLRQIAVDHPLVQRIALLEYLHHGIGLGVRLDRVDRLVAVRIEFLPERVDLGKVVALEHTSKLLEREFDAALHALHGRALRCQRGQWHARRSRCARQARDAAWR